MVMQRLRTSALGQRSRQTVNSVVDRRVNAALKRAGTTGPRGELEVLRSQVDQLQAKMASVQLLFDDAGRGMTRLPSPQHLRTLQDEIAGMAGDAQAAERSVHQAYRILIAFEALGVGRIAGGTTNICGKLATIPLLPAPNDEILEIGTLYGLFAAGLLRMLERSGREPSLTVVDPLVGSQLQPGTSLWNDTSGTPVHERAVRTNLSLAGPAGLAARVEVGYSGDPEVRSVVGDREYGVVIVDGDHSYEGVRQDLEWVETIVAPGGLVVLDDFGDTRWAGVQSALEDHLAAGSTRLTLLGRAATSGFLRAG